MDQLLPQFEADFKIIADEIMRLITLSIEGDKTKLKQFPQEHFLDKFLRGDNVRLYLFDQEHRLICFMPKIDMLKLASRLVKFELRFSYELKKHPEFLSQSITKNNKKDFDFDIPEIKQPDREIFSVFVLGDSHLVHRFSLDTSSAVAFALQFGELNTLNYDRYNSDIFLSFDESSSLKRTPDQAE